MKTIKELDNKSMGFRIGYNVCKKDVLGLIDERIAYLRNQLKLNEEMSVKILVHRFECQIQELEELKKRINGT